MRHWVTGFGLLLLLGGCFSDTPSGKQRLIGEWKSGGVDYLVFRDRGNGKVAFQGDMLEYTLKWTLKKGEGSPMLTLTLSSGLKTFGSFNGTARIGEKGLILAGFDHDKLNGTYLKVSATN